jgi:branched-chain amino acid transport system permease protein
MVYGIIRMINFAHGDFIMIGAYTLFYTIPLMVDAGMPAWMAVIVAVAVCALVGVLVEILAYRPVRKAGPMSALITALAMSIFLENLAMVLAPSRTMCRLFSACPPLRSAGYRCR